MRCQQRLRHCVRGGASVRRQHTHLLSLYLLPSSHRSLLFPSPASRQIDLLEGNRHAFHTTVQDKEGTGSGLGGSFGTRAFGQSAYGPGPSHTIDTTKPFRVSAYFETAGGVIATPVAQTSGHATCSLATPSAPCSTPCLPFALCSDSALTGPLSEPWLGKVWSADGMQQLTAIEMTLTGASGREVHFTVSSRHLGGITPALVAGMTPTASFWSSEDLG